MNSALAAVIIVFMLCMTSLIIFLIQRNDQETIQDLKSERNQLEAKLDTLLKVISDAMNIDYSQTPDPAIIKILLEKFNIYK